MTPNPRKVQTVLWLEARQMDVHEMEHGYYHVLHAFFTSLKVRDAHTRLADHHVQEGMRSCHHLSCRMHRTTAGRHTLC